jgi:SSS family transporter
MLPEPTLLGPMLPGPTLFAALQLPWIDSGVVLLYLGLTLWLGLRIGRGTTTLSGFLIGGRNLPWYAVLGSIIATETSAVTFLSIPGLAFAAQGDFSFLQLALGFILGRLMVIAWLIPGYYQGRYMTAYDVLHKRFGTLTQRTASLIFMGTRTIADGLRLYLTGLVLEQVTGLNTVWSILLMGLATIAYSSLGGIKSVVWNDCIQLIVYLLGALVALAIIILRLPEGLSSIFDYGGDHEKFHILRWTTDFSSENVWAGILGGSFLCLATHGTDQMMVQRYLCARSEAEAKLALGVSGPLIFLQFALFLFVGVALAAFYQHAGITPVESKDQVFAAFIVQEMPTGLRGVTLAAVFAVAMSTLSSSLSSSASAIVNDFLKPSRLRRQGQSTDAPLDAATDLRLTRDSQWWTAIFGGMQIGVACVVALSPALQGKSIVMQVITVAGFASGTILGVFMLGISKRNFAERSIVAGILAGLLVTTLLIAVPNAWTWQIHGWWAAVVASLTTQAVAWSVDWIKA